MILLSSHVAITALVGAFHVRSAIALNVQLPSVMGRRTGLARL